MRCTTCGRELESREHHVDRERDEGHQIIAAFDEDELEAMERERRGDPRRRRRRRDREIAAA